MSLTRRSFLSLLGAGAAGVVIAPVERVRRRVWQVPANAPVEWRRIGAIGVDFGFDEPVFVVGGRLCGIVLPQLLEERTAPAFGDWSRWDPGELAAPISGSQAAMYHERHEQQSRIMAAAEANYTGMIREVVSREELYAPIGPGDVFKVL